MYNVIVAGSRSFKGIDASKYLTRKLDKVLGTLITDVEIVSGHCPTGADALGEDYAKLRGLPLKTFPADWDNPKLGRSAGFVRNNQMASYADALVAFWDGESPGTDHMIKISRIKGLQVRVFTFSIRPVLD